MILKTMTVAGLVMLGATAASAQTAAPAAPAYPTYAYGRTISLAEAKLAAAAAEAEAKKNGWTMVITIVEPNGAQVFSEKMDGTQYGSIEVARKKAETAATFRKPTSVFQEAVKGGTLNSIFTGAMAVDGGEPIISDGKIIGAIGVSGAAGFQDDQCAKAGAAVIK
ncbi:GlcG/HbpS family heme-binding protein [Asticcacaulis solisilvae]|uniref:GlcG/HbpS family heme-binding protein n=1 Tax=Asticcacaulis solisilvae TaxID=1217274 RepID=UPI003FD73D6C